MALSIGNGRYCKLFPGNAPPKRVLIKDLSEPGLLSRAFIQGTVVKVYPIKCSERFGKLCKILLKEDVEKSTRKSQLAVICTFLLGDLADEGSKICEGDCVVLAEVIVECSPTGEHQFQLIMWREKSQASIWAINNKGKVRANTPEGMTTTSIDEVEEAESTTNNKQTADNYDHSESDSDGDLFESCENDFSKSISKDGKETSEQSKQKFFKKSKGKFHLGPKGVTPSTSHVKRRYGNLAIVLDKGEVKMVMKACEEEKYHSKSKTANVHSKGNTGKEHCVCCKNISTETYTCTKPVPNASVPNAGSRNAGTPHTGTPNAVTPNASTPCAGTTSNADVPNTCSPNAVTPNASTPCAGTTSNADVPNACSPNAIICDDFQDKPIEDSVMPEFEQEEHLGMSASKTSASSEIHHGSPAKGTTDRNFGSPHRLKIIAEELVPLSTLRTMIPDDYTPASSLLANQDSTDRGVKRSPLQSSLDPKRLKTSAVPSHQAPLPDRAGNTSSDGSRNRSCRAAAYTVPPGYTTLANLQADTTVNVYGVVKLFKPAWKCRGTDMCSVLMLMDPTIAESSTGLECVLFQPNVSRLPAARRIGDIVRLHRVKISQYQGRLQAKSTRGFAAIVFDRETELPVTAEMARVSSSTFTLTQSDKETVEKLKNWCAVQPVLFPPGNSITLSQINPDSYFDLTCQVLGMALHRTVDCVVLYVTDGTKPVHDLRKCRGEEYNVVEPPCNRSSHDDDVACVFLYGSHCAVARLLVKKGGYVILHNVHSPVLKPGGSASSVLDVVKPYLELCVHTGTAFGRGISVLPADSPEVNQLKKQQKL